MQYWGQVAGEAIANEQAAMAKQLVIELVVEFGREQNQRHPNLRQNHPLHCYFRELAATPVHWIPYQAESRCPTEEPELVQVLG